MSLELKIISKIVTEGSMREVKRMGVAPSLFRTDDGVVTFRWLWEQYHNQNTRGETPSIERFSEYFPEFEFRDSSDSVAALVGDLKTRYALSDLVDLSSRIDDMVADDDNSPEDIMVKVSNTLRKIKGRTVDQSGLMFSEGAEDLIDLYNTMKNSGGISGHRFTWRPLNECAGGMGPGDFIVIYGRTGNMKTWVACNMAVTNFTDGLKVMFYSKEMTRQQLMWRCATIIAQVNATDAWRGQLDEDMEDVYLACLEAIREEDAGCGSFMFLGNEGSKSVMSVDGLAAIAEEFEPDVIYVDGFYHMTDGRTGTKGSDWKQIANIAQDLKNLAQQAKCPVIGITQANRSGAKGASTDLTDLSYADAIGQEADLAIRCFVGPNPEDQGKAVAIVPTKVRNGEPVPFLIAGQPSSDFTIIKDRLNLKKFMASKQKWEESMTDESNGKPKASRDKGTFRL